MHHVSISGELYEQTIAKSIVENLECQITRLFGQSSSYKSFSTNQLTRYDGIEYTYFDPKERLARHES